MSNSLASFVDKFILDPAKLSRPIIDEEGNEETKANLSERIEGEEGAGGAITSISKLRLQNAELLGDKDPRYKGKKTLRKDIQGSDEVSFDPELAKYCVFEEEEDNDDEAGSNSDEDQQDDKAGSNSDEDDDENDELSEDEYNSEASKESNHIQNETSLATKSMKNKKNDGNNKQEEYNYMDFAEEVEEDVDEGSEDDNSDEDEDNDEDESEEEEEEEETHDPIKTFSSDDTDHIQKSLAVKHQCSIFDTLFEARIGLQKASSVACQLPQFDMFEAFLKQKNYPQYKSNLLTARKEVKKLLTQILNLQETLLLNNSETKHIIEQEKEEDMKESDDEAMSNDEESVNPNGIKNQRKNKRKIEEIEETLRKRHKAIIPFRDETMHKWHEKAKLLVTQSRGNFNSFEVDPALQIKNLLANKEQLIKRTQFVGTARGNVYKILGKGDNGQTKMLTEEYDPEIFDDTDFYSRMLEDVLKCKMCVSEDMTEVSRKWIDIQKLRKKAKRKVDTKASKGKKIRFEVLNRLKQFLAPCKQSLMDDDATNKLFSSLFGKEGRNKFGVVK